MKELYGERSMYLKQLYDSYLHFLLILDLERLEIKCKEKGF